MREPTIIVLFRGCITKTSCQAHYGRHARARAPTCCAHCRNCTHQSWWGFFRLIQSWVSRWLRCTVDNMWISFGFVSDITYTNSKLFSDLIASRAYFGRHLKWGKYKWEINCWDQHNHRLFLGHPIHTQKQNKGYLISDLSLNQPCHELELLLFIENPTLH